MKLHLRKTLLTLALSSVLTTIQATEDTSLSESLLNHVILPDIELTEKAVTTLQEKISEAKTERSKAIDKAFSDLVGAWKMVQTTYIIGEVDSDMIDTPQLMDTYHQGNEDLGQQIKRALNSGDKPKIALFKNSFKSINALAIILYTDNALSEAEKDYAGYILTTLENHLQDIKRAYTGKLNLLKEDQDKSMSYILNALIDSAYKLKEWRIGEPAGLSKKYKNAPDGRRQEYPRSHNSLTAALAIISAHEDVMGERPFENLGSVAQKQGAKQQVTAIRGIIADAKSQLNQLKNDNVTDFTDTRFKTLFKTLDKLNDAYYQSLVRALPVQAKILEADGD
ncbi:MAG: hypothetical protein CSA45_01995 [Gammaproteobacteria bacterium]|nr:MAG: hypothetical protein CSA45_01995 [Gammaproteobacteria bacterium]